MAIAWLLRFCLWIDPRLTVLKPFWRIAMRTIYLVQMLSGWWSSNASRGQVNEGDVYTTRDDAQECIDQLKDIPDDQPYRTDHYGLHDATILRFVELSDDSIKLLEEARIMLEASGSPTFEGALLDVERLGYKRGRASTVETLLYDAQNLKATVDGVTLIQQLVKINPDAIRLIDKAIKCLVASSTEHDDNSDVITILNRAIPPVDESQA